MYVCDFNSDLYISLNDLMSIVVICFFFCNNIINDVFAWLIIHYETICAFLVFLSSFMFRGIGGYYDYQHDF